MFFQITSIVFQAIGLVFVLAFLTWSLLTWIAVAAYTLEDDRNIADKALLFTLSLAIFLVKKIKLFALVIYNTIWLAVLIGSSVLRSEKSWKPA